MAALFPKSFSKLPRSQLQSLTLKGFGGGLNAVDDDFTMEPRYSVTLKNFRRTPSGGQQVRLGSNWFANIAGIVNGNILDMVYFNGRIVVVTTQGEIAFITDAGVVTAAWNATIANALPGHPSGWGNTFTTVDFIAFKSDLIIHNGVDKPLNISSALVVTYLNDLATGSNVNVPIGKYGCVAANYHCVAGVPGAPTTIYIGAVGASGVFPGDPAPNDAISIDVGAYAPQGAASIRGLAGFRAFLIVFFQAQTLVVTLGNYDATGVHKPVFPDSLPQFGILGHRCKIPIEHDLLFCGLDGFSDAKRNLFTGLITSDHVSDRIEPLYRSVLGNLTDTQWLNSCYIVHDRLSHDTILFNPTGRHLVHTGSENLHYSAWSEYNFPTAWTCACASFLGRVFYATGTRVFQHGNNVFVGEAYHADRMNDRDTNWTINTNFMAGLIVRDTVGNKSYTCNVNHTSGAVSFATDAANNPLLWTLYTGLPIAFEMELPWLSGRDPMKVKQLRAASVGTKGTAEFTFSVYVDGMFKDDDGNILFQPSLSAAFIGGSTKGFGYDDGPFGGGRRSDDPRIWGFPLKFKLMKIRITGSSSKSLQILSISFLYNRGKYKR